MLDLKKNIYSNIDFCGHGKMLQKETNNEDLYSEIEESFCVANFYSVRSNRKTTHASWNNKNCTI